MWINVKSINQVSWSVVHVLSWWLYEQCKLYNFVHDVNQCIFIRPRYLFTLNRHTCSITITYYFNMFRFITLFIDFCPVVRSRKQQSQCDGTGRLGLDTLRNARYGTAHRCLHAGTGKSENEIAWCLIVHITQKISLHSVPTQQKMEWTILVF